MLEAPDKPCGRLSGVYCHELSWIFMVIMNSIDDKSQFEASLLNPAIAYNLLFGDTMQEKTTSFCIHTWSCSPR